jgi:uncharacterized membrane protein YbhN (UPF0104 family)
LLFAGFLFNAVPWKQMLYSAGHPIDIKVSVISTGLSIFAKYIPGKIWTILGRPSFIKQYYDYPYNVLAVLSLKTQLVTLWTGLVLGTFGLISLGGWSKWGVSSLLLLLVLTFLIFTNFTQAIVSRSYARFFRKNLDLGKTRLEDTIKTLPSFFVQWLLWCSAFYFFSISLYPDFANFKIGLGFALAACLGILSIVAPGGIGVREGILVGFLALAGVELQAATTVAIASRIWFLFGELFIFVLALVLRHARNNMD